MAVATHLGPWLLGTIKNTSGTTAGTIRNVGVCSVAQTDAVLYNDPAASVAFVIPAGSLITSLALYQTTKFAGTSGVITIYLKLLPLPLLLLQALQVLFLSLQLLTRKQLCLLTWVLLTLSSPTPLVLVVLSLLVPVLYWSSIWYVMLMVLTTQLHTQLN